jgi:hypothetical protein
MAFYGFALIGYPIHFDLMLPFKISNNLRIDKPTEYQLKCIRKYLGELSKVEDFREPFENTIIRKREKDIGDSEVYFISSKPRKKNEWLYSVVKFKSEVILGFENPSKELFDLHLSSLIYEKDLYILRAFHNRAYWGWGNLTEQYDHLQQIIHRDGEIIWTLDDLNKLKAIYEKVKVISTNYADIYHSLKLYASIPRLVGYNELICLGLFSIIESILTHNPVSNVDSISHQIKTKINLLSNRFDNEIDYSSFSKIQKDNLWKKLYDFRSRIAHGGQIDFEKTFQVLEDAYTVQLFLEHFLKTLLRNALNEPQLYTDLKRC